MNPRLGSCQGLFRRTQIQNDKMFETNGWAKLMHEAIVIEMETNSEEWKEYEGNTIEE